MKSFHHTLTRLALTLTLAAVSTGLARPAHAEWFTCQPDEVLEFSNRAHVRCSNNIVLGGQTIRYLALSKADVNQLTRFLSLANAAFLSGHTFRAEVVASSASNAAGCGAVDCRTPSAFGLGM